MQNFQGSQQMHKSFLVHNFWIQIFFVMNQLIEVD